MGGVWKGGGVMDGPGSIINGMFQGLDQSLKVTRENQQLRTTVADLVAENERLRELVKKMLKNELYVWIQQFPSSQAAWAVAGDRILGMAQQVGCWFDQGNEVPLDKWRARGGGGVG